MKYVKGKSNDVRSPYLNNETAMDIAITIPEELAEIAQQQAVIHQRTLSQQIVHWANFGKIVEDNPELPFAFLQEVLLARQEAQAGAVEPYEFD